MFFQKRKSKLFILVFSWVLCTLIPRLGMAQRLTPFANREYNLYLTNFIHHDSLAQLSFAKGVILYKQLYSIDSLLYPRKQKHNYFARKIRRESFVQLNKNDFFLQLDPIYNFSGGMDLQDSLNEKLIVNSRGVWVRGNIGSKFSFESSFLENQSTFPAYLDTYADTFKIIPGQGRWKKFKRNGYDYAASSGTISYAPFSFLTFQAGHGKLFIGSGYRSLLLSDNSFNYPYFLIKVDKHKVSYSIIYTSLQVVNKVRKYTSNINEPLFDKKSATFQYLTYKPFKNSTISLFQGTIFQVRDSVHPYFNWNVLNPIIYSSALQYKFNRSPNVLIGADLKVAVTSDIGFYGQYVLDDFSATKNSLRNKTGFQLGANYFNVLGVKNLIFQVEYNQVRPYTYAHSLPASSYSHYGQSLAHPLGANFKEWIGFINYRWKDLLLEFKMNYASFGADSSGKSFGKEIFNSDNFSANGLRSENNSMLQGEKHKLIYQEFKISYLINPATNMNVFVNLINRTEMTSQITKRNQFVYFGVKTSLFNNYYDF